MALRETNNGRVVRHRHGRRRLSGADGATPKPPPRHSKSPIPAYFSEQVGTGINMPNDNEMWVFRADLQGGVLENQVGTDEKCHISVGYEGSNPFLTDCVIGADHANREKVDGFQKTSKTPINSHVFDFSPSGH